MGVDVGEIYSRGPNETTTDGDGIHIRGTQRKKKKEKGLECSEKTHFFESQCT